MAIDTKFTTRSKKTGKTVSVKPTKSMLATVKKIEGQIKKLNSVAYDKVTLQMGTTNQNVVSPYFCYNMTNGMNTWGPIFGNDAADLSDVQKMYVNSYKLDVRLAQNTEAGRIFYTAFVVSLKDQANDVQTWLNSSTGALVLTPGIHYQPLGTDGRVLMNKKYFNIHSYKRFYMGGRAGDQSAPELKDLSFTVVPKQRLIENPGGNIFGAISGRNGLAFPRDPSQNYFLVLFNDNSGLDFEDNFIWTSGLCQAAIPS